MKENLLESTTIINQLEVIKLRRKKPKGKPVSNREEPENQARVQKSQNKILCMILTNYHS